MKVTGEKTSKDRTEELLEDLIQAVEGINIKPVINVQSPDTKLDMVWPKFPEPKAPTFIMPDPQPIVFPEPKKPHAIRCKIVRGTYGEIDYIDLIPLVK